MTFKMKYKNLEEVVKQLKGAVKAHGKQAETIEKHIDEMESPVKKRGLWDNIPVSYTHLTLPTILRV